jgi:hypothetical protein
MRCPRNLMTGTCLRLFIGQKNILQTVAIDTRREVPYAARQIQTARPVDATHVDLAACEWTFRWGALRAGSRRARLQLACFASGRRTDAKLVRRWDAV